MPIEVYQQFMVELLTPNYYVRDRIRILRSEATGQWSIREKNADRSNVKAITTYGTKRMSAYHILEQTLNQRDVRVFDYIEDENGKKKPVLNKKETAIAPVSYTHLCGATPSTTMARTFTSTAFTRTAPALLKLNC